MTKQTFEIAERSSRAFLNERIKETQRKKNEVMSRIANVEQRLECELTADDFERVSRLRKDAAERMFMRTRQNHLTSWKDLSERRDLST